MSKYADLKQAFDNEVSHASLDPTGDNETITVASQTEATFRFWLLRLLFEIHGDLDSIAADYKALLKMQKDRQR